MSAENAPKIRPGGGRPEGGPPAPRFFVTYAFYKFDNAFRREPDARRREMVAELRSHLESESKRIQLHTYSTAGFRPDVDFLLWRISPDIAELNRSAVTLGHTRAGAFLTTPHSFLAQTRRSIYVDQHQHPGSEGTRLYIKPSESKFLFVYPFWKTHDWYQLPMADRQKMMDEHIAVGHEFPNIKINTTYSFGLDDQEFVVAFEGDDPAEFLDLVMKLRSSKARPYTLRDTPIFTCLRKTIPDLCDEF